MKYRITIDKYQCERCGHMWISRIPTIPKQCPKCRNRYWATPKKSKKK